jgi:hypothetical protein
MIDFSEDYIDIMFEDEVTILGTNLDKKLLKDIIILMDIGSSNFSVFNFEELSIRYYLNTKHLVVFTNKSTYRDYLKGAKDCIALINRFLEIVEKDNLCKN